MPQTVNFEGQRYTFPDDATDDEISAALSAEPAKQASPGSSPLNTQLPPGTPERAPTQITVTPARPAGMPNFSPAPPDRPPERPIAAGVQGAARSVADTLGLLPDIANMGANALLAGTDFVSRKVGGPDVSYRFPMASDSMANVASNLAETAGVPVLDPETMRTHERLAYNVNRFGGQGALTAGVMAPLAAARATNAASKFPQFGDSLLRPYTVAPISTAVGDTAAGAGGGVGLTAAQSAPDSVRRAGGGLGGVFLDLAAMLGGQIGGGTAAGLATRGPGQLVDQVKQKLFPMARDVPLDPETRLPVTNAVADRAASFIQSQTADPASAAEAIRRAANDFRNMGAPVPTAGVLSNDPKLAALERGQRRLNPSEFVTRDIALRDAALDTADSVRPKNVDPRVATDFMQGEVSRRIGDATGALRASEGRLAQADAGERSLGDTVKAFAGRGGTASGTLDRLATEKALVPAQREKNRLYSEIDPDRNVMRDVEPMVTLAGDIERQVAEIPAALQREMIPQQLINDIRGMARRTEERTITSPLMDESGRPITRTETAAVGGTGEMSFGAMNEMRSGLASASTAARKAGQYRLAENLDRFRSLISRESEALAAEGGPAGQRAQAASDYYRNEFAPVWNRGPGDEAAKFRKDFNTDRENRTTTPPTATASRFLGTGPGSKEKAESLSRVVDSMADPSDKVAATAAVRQYVLDDMSRTVGADGKINTQNLARWLNGPGGWNDALSQFPQVQAEARKILSDALEGKLSRNVTAVQVERAAAGLKRTQQEIDNSALSLVIGREPTKAARSVLESRDPQMAMREIRQTIGGNKSVLPAWQRAVMDHLIDRITNVDPAGVSSGDRAINYGKLVKTFDRYEGALAELYSGEKMNALRQTQKLLEPLARTAGPANTAMVADAGNASLWKLLELGLKAHYGILKGGGVLRTLKIAATMGGDDTVAANRLVTRMMLDPELASHLLTREVKAVGAPAWNDKLAKLLRYTQVGREAFGEE